MEKERRALNLRGSRDLRRDRIRGHYLADPTPALGAGVWGSELRGWYESATELTTNGTAVFTFAVNPQEDKTFTPAQILRGAGGEIAYNADRSAFEIANTWRGKSGALKVSDFPYCHQQKNIRMATTAECKAFAAMWNANH